ncbi:MAG TPA: phosphotransferase [Gaiellaceae bacterium]|jgi:trehalose synthase-fused probable maltokinase
MTDDRSLVEFITSQRWYGSKTRDVVSASVIDRATLREGLDLQLVEVRFDTGTHETYQLLTDAGGFDALADEAQARQLLRLIRGSETVEAGEGTIEFAALAGHAGAGEPRQGRLIGSEQSNSSIVFDEALILKVFRRIEAGINPELELLRFLTEAAFANIAQLAGWYAYTGRHMDATLGIMQRFVVGAEDGWERALDAAVGGDEAFLDTLRRLGEVTGTMHSVLGSNPGDPNFCPEQTSMESLGLLTATVDEEIERVFMSLPDDVAELEPIRGRGEEVRERLRLLTNIGGTGRVIRVHGDYHLGQTLWTGEDWIILDFEGEPARPLPERRRKRSPLRDVAGMLRSFAYAASAAPVQRGVAAPDEWEERAREEFLEGYRTTIDQSLVPSGTAMDKLLQVFELEKAVYELRYELNNRPDWVRIPVAGIARLLEEEVPV